MGWATLFEYTDEVVEEITLDFPGAPHALLNVRFWRRKKPYDQALYAQAKREVLDSVRAIWSKICRRAETKIYIDIRIILR